MTAIRIPHRPVTIPHDQHGAGLREWIPIDVATAHPPVGWLVLLVVAFVAGFLCGGSLR